MKRLLIGLFALAALHSTARAEYPERQIRVIVPFGAGGSIDVVARVIGTKMAEVLNVPVAVFNKPGAGGNIGASEIARSAPDGYSLLISGPTSLALSRSLAETPFKYPDDFTPISLTASAGYSILVGSNEPYKSLQELIDASKKDPKIIKIGVAAVGSGNHLAIEYLKSKTGLNGVSVNFPGNAGVATALLGGYINMAVDAASVALPYVKAGQMRALAVTSLSRSKLLPDIPTVAESNFPDFNFGFSVGFFAPKGTPAPIAEKLSRTIAEIVRSPEIKERLETLGYQVHGNTPSEFKVVIDEENSRVDKMVKDLRAHGLME